MSRGCVYTVILGRKDRLQRVTGSPDCDFICLTDDPDIRGGKRWKRVLLPETDEDKGLSLRQRSRRPKLLQDWPGAGGMLLKYDWSIYLDGSLHLLVPAAKIVARELKQHDLAVYRHPWRDCAYDEAEEVVAQGRETADRAAQAVKRLEAEQYPRHNGLSTCMMIVRRHTPRVREFNLRWWSAYLEMSQRDQLSFNFTAWKQGLEIKSIEGSPYDGSVYTKFQRHLIPTTADH